MQNQRFQIPKVWSAFSKSAVFKMFSFTKKRKPAFLNFSRLKSVLEKLQFREGMSVVSVYQ